MRSVIPTKEKAETFVSAFIKIWRQPTLAEAIQPLPLARLCLTAVFGMGTGRTTALWPPKILTHGRNKFTAAIDPCKNDKEPPEFRKFSENYTQVIKTNLVPE